MMKRTVWIAATLALLGALALPGCKKERETLQDPIIARQGELKVRSELAKAITRSGGLTKEGDAMGIIALNAGNPLSASSVYGGYSNVKYTTNGSGVYVPATQGINFPEGGEKLDFVAYYPYTAGIENDFVYKIDARDQRELAKIDLLYSDNAKGHDKGNSTVQLNFKHKLMLVVFQLQSDGAAVSGSNAQLKGVTTDGSMTLADGKVTLGSSVNDVQAAFNEKTPNQLYEAAFILPAQGITGKSVVMRINGADYAVTVPSVDTKESFRTNIPVKFGAGGLSLIVSGVTIEPWNVNSSDPIELVGTPSAAMTVSKSSVTFDATGALSEAITLTAEASDSWSATSDQPWLSVTPASGSGSGTITLTAEANSEAARNATVTIVAGAKSVTVAVNQKAGTSSGGSATTGTHFTGGDFESWDTFTATLNSYGAKPYVKHSATGGRNGSGALHLDGTPSRNDYAFTIASNGYAGGNLDKIEFYIKGSISGKSLSFNLYGTPAKNTNGAYATFNLGNVAGGSDEITLEEAASNGYTGSVNTNGKWVKVTIQVPIPFTITPDSNNSLFAVKVGKGGEADLFIDDITYTTR